MCNHSELRFTGTWLGTIRGHSQTRPRTECFFLLLQENVEKVLKIVHGCFYQNYFDSLLNNFLNIQCYLY